MICWFLNFCISRKPITYPSLHLCPQRPVCLLSSPNSLTINVARFSPTGVEVSSQVAAFTFGLLKTGDKKPAARKESKTLKVVIYHLCQTSAKTVWKTAPRVRKQALLSSCLIPACLQTSRVFLHTHKDAYLQLQYNKIYTTSGK